MQLYKWAKQSKKFPLESCHMSHVRNVKTLLLLSTKWTVPADIGTAIRSIIECSSQYTPWRSSAVTVPPVRAQETNGLATFRCRNFRSQNIASYESKKIIKSQTFDIFVHVQMFTFLAEELLYIHSEAERIANSLTTSGFPMRPLCPFTLRTSQFAFWFGFDQFNPRKLINLTRLLSMDWHSVAITADHLSITPKLIEFFSSFENLQQF